MVTAIKAHKPWTITFDIEGEDAVKFFNCSIALGVPAPIVAKDFFLQALHAPQPDYNSVSWEDA